MNKPDVIYTGYCSQDCTTWYKCPICGEQFSDWTLTEQNINEHGTKGYCPKCKTELNF